MIDLKKGEKIAAIATLLTFFLALGKGIVGFFSGSVALMTDALHSTVDILTIFSAWAGLKIAGRKSDKIFPYGYYKAENLATLFISIIIIFISIGLLIHSYDQLFKKPEISWGIIALMIPIISSIVSFGISKYEIKIGKEIGSQALISNGKESLMDTFSSLAVFLAILGSLFGLPYLDGMIGIIISLLILKIGLETIKDSLFALMDVSPGKDIENQIIKEIKNIDGVKNYSNLKLRKSGPFIFGEVNIKTERSADITRAHQISDKIEKKLKNKLTSLESIIVHLEPYKKEKIKICLPIKKDNGLNSVTEEKLGKAKKYIFINLKNGKITDQYIKENKFKGEKHLIGLNMSKFLIKENTDILITKEVGEITFHTLRDSFIEIYKAEDKNVKTLIKKLKNKELKPIIKPTKESKG